MTHCSSALALLLQHTGDEEETPRSLLLNALPAPLCTSTPQRGLGAGGTESVALLRTAALYLYSWRVTSLSDNGDALARERSPMAVVNRAADERQTETLLARAIELEPFHVPTLTALAFVLLQRSGGCAVARADRLLEKAVDSAGPRGMPSDIFHHFSCCRKTGGLWRLLRLCSSSIVGRGVPTALLFSPIQNNNFPFSTEQQLPFFVGADLQEVAPANPLTSA